MILNLENAIKLKEGDLLLNAKKGLFAHANLSIE